MPHDEDRMSEAVLIYAIERHLPDLLGASQPRVTREARLPAGGGMPDFLVEEASGQAFVVEVKTALPATQIRIESIINQLNGFAHAYMEMRKTTRKPTPVLVTTGVMSRHSLERLAAAGVRVIDGPALRDFIDDRFLDLLPTQGGGLRREPLDRGSQLLRRLSEVQPGRADWSKYQRLAQEILTFTLCPPLEQPLPEHSNASGINRRDIILPNYSTSGFWHYMQMNYSAHYVVVDAKNYTKRVKKDAILQLANYLSEHGTGLFGAIVTRSAGDRGAEATRREQWVINRKLIVILNDSDLEQMIQLKQPGGDPGLVIRQKIEDFRLSF